MGCVIILHFPTKELFKYNLTIEDDDLTPEEIFKKLNLDIDNCEWMFSDEDVNMEILNK